ncbi:phage shock protein operon transcriptional activator [Puniceicoccales bacterium CK1056]|uniref:Phage shock protein operon transcriptional activator n=1 Tax=Oceanipulchritudo coccoides TaxID=2706888 RepID=A0A6B2M3P7_9BACT|nr:phage shock protein operon transcriptional activator [Oceanipulchritudo coccoides]NDV62724.1 phage shock protein operon transcriptional activator [Oceanipulchritudo coccoides]
MRSNTEGPFEGSVGKMEALGESEAFVDFQERLSRVAQVDRPVLIVGERGTGKELAVSRLHYLSRRWQGPLVALNCAALSPTVLESELFGHEAGAFTGAAKQRLGRFEAANEGTLFLDEVGLVPVTIQEKILRVVEYRQFERVGGSHPVRVDVRIIGATNADLPGLASQGKFKRDLLDRLSFEVLFLPPLRERREDIELLARNFATRMAMELGWRETPEFSDNAMDSLHTYRWPGNIRELKNVVERAVYASDGVSIDSVNFDPFDNPFAKGPLEIESDGQENGGTESSAVQFIPGESSLEEMVRELEVTALKAALESAKFHQGEAAKLLGLTYHQFRGLFRKHRDVIDKESNAQK